MISRFATFKGKPAKNAMRHLRSNLILFATSAVILAWSTNTVDLDFASYSLYSALSAGGPYSVVASNLIDTSYANTGLVNGVTNYYVVAGQNLSGTIQLERIVLDNVPICEAGQGME